jgi:hypothetical protein
MILQEKLAVQAAPLDHLQSDTVAGAGQRSKMIGPQRPYSLHGFVQQIDQGISFWEQKLSLSTNRDATLIVVGLTAAAAYLVEALHLTWTRKDGGGQVSRRNRAQACTFYILIHLAHF